MPREKQLIRLHSKLMLVLLVIITLGVAAFATSILSRQRDTLYAELEDRADRLADLAGKSLAYSIWNIDLVAIEGLLESLAQEPDVILCRITALGYGTLYEIAKPVDHMAGTIERHQDISFPQVKRRVRLLGKSTSF